MNDKTKKILMALGVVFSAAMMLTLYFVDWAAIGSVKTIDQGDDLHPEFQKHIATTNLEIKSKEEYEARYKNFKNVDAQIKAHNALESNFKLGHNHLSSMFDDEKALMRGDPTYFQQHMAETAGTT